jgi:hypothetical protein
MVDLEGGQPVGPSRSFSLLQIKMWVRWTFNGPVGRGWKLNEEGWKEDMKKK